LILIRANENESVRDNEDDCGLVIGQDPHYDIERTELYLRLAKRSWSFSESSMITWASVQHKLEVPTSLKLVSVIPKSRWEGSNNTVNSRSPTAFIFSYPFGSKSFVFLLLCCDWYKLIDSVFVLHYSAPAAHFIQQAISTFHESSGHGLQTNWSLNPAAFTTSTDNNDSMLVSKSILQFGHTSLTLAIIGSRQQRWQPFGISITVSAAEEQSKHVSILR
jgi:hypothetical protein